MEIKEDPITKSLVSPVKDLLVDMADLGLDELMGLMKQSTEVMEKVPFVKWLFLANDVRTFIQSAFFLRKYANFIGPIHESLDKNAEEVSKLEALYRNDKKYKKLIEYSIIALDRYQTELKARLLGVLFSKTFKESIFTPAEYNAILFSIENIHPYSGIECLEEFYQYRKKMESEKDDELRREIWADGANIDYSPLSNSTLLDFFYFYSIVFDSRIQLIAIV